MGKTKVSSNFQPSLPFSSYLQIPSFWQMCLGKHHMNSSLDVPSAEKCYKVDGFISHEGYVSSQNPINDIALVHLAEPVSMTEEISPICLPQPGAMRPVGTPCYATGWGDKEGRRDHLF